MRRQDIQLLARAKQGDPIARCEAARRYLAGSDGFPRHPETAIDYLQHPVLHHAPAACTVLAEGLALDELVRLQQLDALAIAASSRSGPAMVKLAAWKLATWTDPPGARACLLAAAARGERHAREALDTLLAAPDNPAGGALRVLDRRGDIHAVDVMRLAAADAIASNAEPGRLGQVIRCMLSMLDPADPLVAPFVRDALEASSTSEPWWESIAPDKLERCLEAQVARGDAKAALILGRALCGIDHHAMRAAALVDGTNMRRGAAYLLRAADSGCSEAWMLLYRIHADHRLSVANPQLARFFLEKAALVGDVAAQRRLGALTLRDATTVQETEIGIHWLHQAASRDDPCAAHLLRSLVLPVGGDDAVAEAAIESIRREDPWMACRLRVARDFGLTKLEALSVDLVSGLRPWGLMVGTNPFVTQSRRSAARAVPALSAEAARSLRRSAALFEQSRRDNPAVEGDLRRRASRLKRLLERHGADEAPFFAEVPSRSVDALRCGRKWAARARAPLQMALTA